MTAADADSSGLTIWTIGHSARPVDELIRILEAYGIELLVDVRRFPGSRKNPQYSEASLDRSLGAAGIAYHWIGELGGRRRPDADSPNQAWRHPAFRAYADHVETEEFAQGLFELLLLARGLRTAIMCSEILWWRCHRRLVSDVLVSLGVRVIHIRDEKVAGPHRITEPAQIVDGRLSYRG